MNTPEYCFETLRTFIQSQITETGAPSLAVSVARNGKVIWEEAFGWANREKRVPATIHTPYSLASVSKPITTTALMKLVEAGKIDLDKPVNDYLAPGSRLNVWIGNPEEVTVRRLASHTAGLPGQLHFYIGDEIKSKPPREEAIRRYGNIITPPGERYRYSNFGFGLLDHIVARVSGMSFGDYLRNEVFLPLGMYQSFVDIGTGPSADSAIRYGEQPIPFYECDHPGASSVWSSVHDLMRFGLFHLGQTLPDQKPILSRESLAAMHRSEVIMKNVNPTDLNLRPNTEYGLGWCVDNDEVDYRIGHGGGMMGAASKLLFIPKEGIVIATVCNAFNPLAYTIERQILCQLLPDYAEKFARFDAWKKDLDRANEEAAGRLPSTELTGEWEGALHTYEKVIPFRLSFQADGDLHAKLGDQLTTLVNDARFTNGCLTGRMAGSVETTDATRRPYHPFHHLALDLKLRGSVLNGALVANAGNILSHWVELRKI